MFLKDWMYTLIKKFNLDVFFTKMAAEKAGELVDQNKIAQTITDKIASGGTVIEVVSAYVQMTESINDDDIPNRANEIIDVWIDGLHQLKNKPILDIVNSIKIGDRSLGDLPVPDLDEDVTNNLKLSELLAIILK